MNVKDVLKHIDEIDPRFQNMLLLKFNIHWKYVEQMIHFFVIWFIFFKKKQKMSNEILKVPNCFVLFQDTIRATIKKCSRCFQSLFNVGEKQNKEGMKTWFHFFPTRKMFLFFKWGTLNEGQKCENEIDSWFSCVEIIYVH